MSRTPGPHAAALSVPRKLELLCSGCGYGIVCRELPERCPMCRSAGAWVEPTAARLGGECRGAWLV